MERRRSPLGRQCARSLPSIKRRHARQRIAEERGGQALLLAQLFAAITLSHCQRIRPKTRRERRRRNAGKQFGHFSLPRPTSHAAALGHASTLAKRWRLPVPIRTKSGRQDAPRRCFCFMLHACGGASQRQMHARAPQLGCAAMSKHAGATTDSSSSLSRGAHACSRVSAPSRVRAPHDEDAFAALNPRGAPSNIARGGYAAGKINIRSSRIFFGRGN